MRGGPPWGADERAPRLRRRLDGLEDGGDRAVGRLVGHQVEPGSKDAIGVARAWSCHPSFGDRRGRVGFDRRAQRPGGVVQSRSGGPGRDAEGLGDLDQGQPEVVVQDEDRALLDGQASERAVEGVAIRDGDDLVRTRRSVDRQGRTFAAHVLRRLASA